MNRLNLISTPSLVFPWLLWLVTVSLLSLKSQQHRGHTTASHLQSFYFLVYYYSVPSSLQTILPLTAKITGSLTAAAKIACVSQPHIQTHNQIPKQLSLYSSSTQWSLNPQLYQMLTSHLIFLPPPGLCKAVFSAWDAFHYQSPY